jgi:2-dehydro-3-deoxy-D-arabinonate dehydratase
MKVYHTRKGIVIEHQDSLFLTKQNDWNLLVNRPQLFSKLLLELRDLQPDPALSEYIEKELLPPIGGQELWASGVTYLKSRKARMEESQDAGGGDFYARVYDAERPEIFFKAPSYRTVGSGMNVRIRKDSKWNVPEPELTLFICSSGSIEGYTIGNDMSSRDIEGENPLYLPQAKSYDGAAALGPCLYVPEGPIHPDSLINITIERKNQMKRKHTELVEYLFREMSFPSGVYLMTGTGIVPPGDFTLHHGDVVKITIENIGTLVNTVA